MAHKNDYTCIVYFSNSSPKKWVYVHGLYGFSQFLDRNHPTWTYFNVYNRRLNTYLKRFYKGNFIPTFLTTFAFALIGIFFLTFNENTLQSQKSSFNNGLNNTATISTQYLKKGGSL